MASTSSAASGKIFPRGAAGAVCGTFRSTRSGTGDIGPSPYRELASEQRQRQAGLATSSQQRERIPYLTGPSM